MDGNVANRLTFKLSFTVTHRDNVNAKIYAPSIAAPQTDAYLALRRIRITNYFAQLDHTLGVFELFSGAAVLPRQR